MFLWTFCSTFANRRDYVTDLTLLTSSTADGYGHTAVLSLSIIVGKPVDTPSKSSSCRAEIDADGHQSGSVECAQVLSEISHYKLRFAMFVEM